MKSPITKPAGRQKHTPDLTGNIHPCNEYVSDCQSRRLPTSVPRPEYRRQLPPSTPMLSPGYHPWHSPCLAWLRPVTARRSVGPLALMRPATNRRGQTINSHRAACWLVCVSFADRLWYDTPNTYKKGKDCPWAWRNGVGHSMVSLDRTRLNGGDSGGRSAAASAVSETGRASH